MGDAGGRCVYSKRGAGEGERILERRAGGGLLWFPENEKATRHKRRFFRRRRKRTPQKMLRLIRAPHIGRRQASTVVSSSREPEKNVAESTPPLIATTRSKPRGATETKEDVPKTKPRHSAGNNAAPAFSSDSLLDLAIRGRIARAAKMQDVEAATSAWREVSCRLDALGSRLAETPYNIIDQFNCRAL